MRIYIRRRQREQARRRLRELPGCALLALTLLLVGLLVVMVVPTALR